MSKKKGTFWEIEGKKKFDRFLTYVCVISVPRWDEGESTTSHIRERKRDLTIGYIGDEW